MPVVLDRDGLRRNLLRRKRAASHLRRGILEGQTKFRTERLAEGRHQPRAHRFHFGERTRKRPQCREVLGESGGLPIQPERRFQRGDGQLAAAQCPVKGVPAELIHTRGGADDQTGLRPSQHFVAAERHDVGAERDALRDHRFLRQAVLAQVDERAAPKIFHDRDGVRLSDRDEIGQADVGHKADDLVVAGVHLQQQPGLRGDRAFVVRGVRAVGGAHLFEDRAASGHDLRNPERAANLNQLAARHDHFLAARQRVQGKEHRGGVVVDHRGRFGAREIDEQLFDHLLAPSAFTEIKVVFQVDGARAGAVHRLEGRPEGAARVPDSCGVWSRWRSRLG